MPTDSLSSHKVHNRASKIAISDVGITEVQLDEAMHLLPYEDYKILYGVYVEGKTQVQLAKDYGISKDSVHRKVKRGIMQLKKHFGV